MLLLVTIFALEYIIESLINVWNESMQYVLGISVDHFVINKDNFPKDCSKSFNLAFQEFNI